MGESSESFKVDRDTVKKVVCALQEFAKKKEETSPAFIDDGEIIKVQLSFKKIPQVQNKVIKVRLPVSFIKPTSDVCLFVKDMDKRSRDYETSVKHFNELLKSKDITSISQVIPLKALKIEYKPYEAKHNLSNMYDSYLGDARIIRRLPSLLGKNFYKRKRYPVPVNLEAKDLKQEIERGLATSMCILAGKGSSSQVVVANTTMTCEDVVCNVMATVDRLFETVPGGSANLRTLHLKTLTSPALPFYVSTDSGEDVVLPSEDSDTEEGEPEELSTALDMKVLVTSKGEIKLFDAESNKKVWQSGSSLEPQPKRRRIGLPLPGKRKGKKQRKLKQEKRNNADTMTKSVALGSKKPSAKVMKKQPTAKGLKKGSTPGKGTKKVRAGKVIVKKEKNEQQ